MQTLKILLNKEIITKAKSFIKAPIPYTSEEPPHEDTNLVLDVTDFRYTLQTFDHRDFDEYAEHLLDREDGLTMVGLRISELMVFFKNCLESLDVAFLSFTNVDTRSREDYLLLGANFYLLNQAGNNLVTFNSKLTF